MPARAGQRGEDHSWQGGGHRDDTRHADDEEQRRSEGGERDPPAPKRPNTTPTPRAESMMAMSFTSRFGWHSPPVSADRFHGAGAGVPSPPSGRPSPRRDVAFVVVGGALGAMGVCIMLGTGGHAPPWSTFFADSAAPRHGMIVNFGPAQCITKLSRSPTSTTAPRPRRNKLSPRAISSTDHQARLPLCVILQRGSCSA